MITRFMAELMMDPRSGQAVQAPMNNDDLRNHEAEIAGGPFYMRVMPRYLRAWIEQRRTENALIALWQNSPHLLSDVGVVLGRSQDLPDHLIPAPMRLLEEVAATTPQAIAEAELEFPPAPTTTRKSVIRPASEPIAWRAALRAK